MIGLTKIFININFFSPKYQIGIQFAHCALYNVYSNFCLIITIDARATQILSINLSFDRVIKTLMGGGGGF